MQMFRTISIWALAISSTLISLNLVVLTEITAFNLFVAFPILFLIAFAAYGYLIEARVGFMVSSQKKRKIEELDGRSILRVTPKCSFSTKLKVGSDKVA